MKPDISLGLLEAAILETIQPFDDLEVFSSANIVEGTSCLIIWQKHQVYYPRMPRLVENPEEWRELNCVVRPVRILISGSSLRASLQVFGNEIGSVSPVIKATDTQLETNSGTEGFDSVTQHWSVAPELLELVRQVTVHGQFRLCEGFSSEQLNLDKPNSGKSTSLVTKYIPFLRYESPHCQSLISPRQCREKTICHSCKLWFYNQIAVDKRRQQNEFKDVDLHVPKHFTPPPKKRLKTDPSSRIQISSLSPSSQKIRISNVCLSRRVFSQQVVQLQKKIKKMSITLSNDQNNEMIDVVRIISNKFNNELEEVIKDGDNSQVSRKLRQVWKSDRFSQHKLQTESFFKDQVKNCTGFKGNSWSSVTYRLALAVYVRSPAAYSALKSFRILNLPSKRSLRDFTTARLQTSGMNHEYICDQREMYLKLKEEQKTKGLSEPLGEGVLIFDEVRVIAKLMWNSSNNQLLGLAMRPEDYSTLSDIHRNLLGESESEKPTNYILQFLWRDVSFNFDVIGPYIPSNGPIKKEILTGCMLDAIRLFESYGFHVRAVVCDGASTNLSLIKSFMHRQGPFGHDETIMDLFDRHTVTPSFKHPFRPFHRIFFIICPSHELKSLVTALYSSRPSPRGGTKLFEKDGVAFGWSAPHEVFDEDVKRAKKGDAKRVKGLLKSYITRDSWTRLNVKPAKIMQQEEMLSALYQIANPTNSPAPAHQTEIMMAREYLTSCNLIFETSILDGTKKITCEDDPFFEHMLKGYRFFIEWLNELLCKCS